VVLRGVSSLIWRLLVRSDGTIADLHATLSTSPWDGPTSTPNPFCHWEPRLRRRSTWWHQLRENPRGVRPADVGLRAARAASMGKQSARLCWTRPAP